MLIREFSAGNVRVPGGKLTDILHHHHPSNMGIGGATMSTQGQQQNALIEDVQIKPIDRMLDGGGDDDSEEERRKFRKGITMA